jgi:caffeoyl-CoA O-methyltransferase
VSQDRWTTVDTYFEQQLVGEDDILAGAIDAGNEAGLPEIQVAATQGKLLNLLAKVQGARRILEIGTLAGYSTIWLARALPEDGTLVSLEIDPKHAQVARRNVERAGFGDRVEICVGRAVDTLKTMIEAGEAPFDFIFIDADKPSNPAYLDAAVKLSRPGTLIFVDNVVRNGGVADPQSNDPNVTGVREMVDAVAVNPALSATAIQTVGTKGYDGFALIRVS